MFRHALTLNTGSSYPYEYPRVTFERYVLDEDMWYTSAMDAFISTMETNALSGKNVARLVMDKWMREMVPAEYERLLDEKLEGMNGY